MNRDFQAFEWFVELLGELELQQLALSNERFIQIHLYMTSAKVQQEIKIDIQKALDLKKKKLFDEILNESNKDFSLKLIPGRPNLETVTIIQYCPLFDYYYDY